MGVAKDGSKKDIFQPGVELKGKSCCVHILLHGYGSLGAGYHTVDIAIFRYSICIVQ